MKLKKFMGIIAAVSIISVCRLCRSIRGGRTAYRLCNRQRREIHAWSGIHT